MQSFSFRCRFANWSGFIRAYIDKPGTTSYDSAKTTNDRAPSRGRRRSSYSSGH